MARRYLILKSGDFWEEIFEEVPVSRDCVLPSHGRKYGVFGRGRREGEEAYQQVPVLRKDA